MAFFSELPAHPHELSGLSISEEITLKGGLVKFFDGLGKRGRESELQILNS